MAEGDAFKKVRAGETFKAPAQAWNAFIDAARAHRRNLGARGPAPQLRSVKEGLIRVKNTTDDDVSEFNVLGLDDEELVFSPEDNEEGWKRTPVLKGVVPEDGTHDSKYVITQEPIPQGKIGIARIFGYTPVLLDVDNESDTHAVIVDEDTTKMASSTSGSAQILWKESGTGEVNALVRFPFSTFFSLVADRFDVFNYQYNAGGSVIASSASRDEARPWFGCSYRQRWTCCATFGLDDDDNTVQRGSMDDIYMHYMGYNAGGSHYPAGDPIYDDRYSMGVGTKKDPPPSYLYQTLRVYAITDQFNPKTITPTDFENLTNYYIYENDKSYVLWNLRIEKPPNTEGGPYESDICHGQAGDNGQCVFYRPQIANLHALKIELEVSPTWSGASLKRYWDIADTFSWGQWTGVSLKQ